MKKRVTNLCLECSKIYSEGFNLTPVKSEELGKISTCDSCGNHAYCEKYLVERKEKKE